MARQVFVYGIKGVLLRPFRQPSVPSRALPSPRDRLQWFVPYPMSTVHLASQLPSPSDSLSCSQELTFSIRRKWRIHFFIHLLTQPLFTEFLLHVRL